MIICNILQIICDMCTAHTNLTQMVKMQWWTQKNKEKWLRAIQTKQSHIWIQLQNAYFNLYTIFCCCCCCVCFRLTLRGVLRLKCLSWAMLGLEMVFKSCDYAQHYYFIIRWFIGWRRSRYLADSRIWIRFFLSSPAISRWNKSKSWFKNSLLRS